VWVTNPAFGLVQKIDVASNRVVATIKVGSTPRFFAIGEGGVWTLDQDDGSVTRIDPATGTVVATIPAGVAGSGGDMTAGGGWVWARGTDILLSQIDPRTNTVVRRYGPPSGSGAAVVGFGAVWVSAHDISTVWRLPLPSP
jgi:YVTN family beta-propeller protein